MTGGLRAGAPVRGIVRLSAALARAICAPLMAGESQVAICAEPGMPSRGTLTRWARERRAFGEGAGAGASPGRAARDGDDDLLPHRGPGDRHVGERGRVPDPRLPRPGHALDRHGQSIYAMPEPEFAQLDPRLREPGRGLLRARLGDGERGHGGDRVPDPRAPGVAALDGGGPVAANLRPADEASPDPAAAGR